MKKLLPDIIAILAFVVISFVYFFPADIEGRILFQHDSAAGAGAGRDAQEYFERTVPENVRKQAEPYLKQFITLQRFKGNRRLKNERNRTETNVTTRQTGTRVLHPLTPRHSNRLPATGERRRTRKYNHQ